MVHIGLICPSANGHLNPMTTLGRELASRGHQVSLMGVLDSRAKAESVGLNHIAIGQDRYPEGSLADLFAEVGRQSGLAAMRSTLAAFHDVTRIILEQAPGAIRNNSIDFLLIDQSSFGAAEVALHLEVPFVSVCCALMFNQEPCIPPINTTWGYRTDAWGRIRNRLGYQLVVMITRALKQQVDDYRRRWSLPRITDGNDMFSSLAQVCQQPVEFEFPRTRLPEHFHFTGPFAHPSCREASDFPLERLDGRPLIYASLGTIQNRLAKHYRTIAQACQGLDAQLVIALGGGSDPTDMTDLPGDSLVVGYAPQLELLPKARLTITHAGMNTALESLKYGVPMVALPITNDQPGVASRIVWSGTGEMLKLRQLSSKRLRVKIDQVLDDPTYRQRAQAMQDAIARAGGTSRAAEIIEEVIRTGRPVRAR